MDDEVWRPAESIMIILELFSQHRADGNAVAVVGESYVKD